MSRTTNSHLQLPEHPGRQIRRIRVLKQSNQRLCLVVASQLGSKDLALDIDVLKNQSLLDCVGIFHGRSRFCFLWLGDVLAGHILHELF